MILQGMQHVQDVFSKRKIPTEWIDRTVDEPDSISVDKIASENHNKGAICR